MPKLPDDLYRRWLEAVFPTPALHEDFIPPERWLQQVWRHQRLRRELLCTIDGEPVRVLHPGFWNRGAGPDFQQAILQFGEAPAQQGDVEIDLVPAGWRGHHHATNPAFQKVILHVIWDARHDAAGRPALALRPFLDAPLSELAPWLQTEAPRLLPDNVPGRCAAPLADLTHDALEGLVRQAALARLTRKASEFAVRARHAGWRQSLWEGLVGGLGYRHNVWPMRRIAEITGAGGTPPLADLLGAQARLLGLAGLLPADLPARNGDYVRALWDRWWRERDHFHGSMLPSGIWRLGGLRPANHPHRRLALAGHWLYNMLPGEGFDAWLADSDPHPDVSEALHRVLGIPSDSFWDHHWTLGSGPMLQSRPLLGRPRLTDLAVNAVLPWLLARAETGADPLVRRRIEERYLEWPAGEENAVLRLARQRLLGGRRRCLPRSAAMQQGLLALSQDFCAHADARCTGCRLPGLVDGTFGGRQTDENGRGEPAAVGGGAGPQPRLSAESSRLPPSGGVRNVP